MVTTGVLAASTAVLVWAFIELFGRIYPTRATWLRLRRARGRFAVRRMRERFEEAGERTRPRRLALGVFLLLLAWIGAAGLLEKRWYEVLLDAIPSLIVILGLLRIPAALRAVALRMRDYERWVGEDPDKPFFEDEDGGDGSGVIAL